MLLTLNAVTSGGWAKGLGVVLATQTSAWYRLIRVMACACNHSRQANRRARRLDTLNHIWVHLLDDSADEWAIEPTTSDDISQLDLLSYLITFRYDGGRHHRAYALRLSNEPLEEDDGNARVSRFGDLEFDLAKSWMLSVGYLISCLADWPLQIWSHQLMQLWLGVIRQPASHQQFS